MQTKLLELRDRDTFIPLLCVNMNVSNPKQFYLLRRCGYPCDGRPNIAITHLQCGGDPCSNDPYHWGGRTYPVAHNYIIDHWGELSDGDIVDVEFILGETKKPKVSESKENVL